MFLRIPSIPGQCIWRHKKPRGIVIVLLKENIWTTTTEEEEGKRNASLVSVSMDSCHCFPVLSLPRDGNVPAAITDMLLLTLYPLTLFEYARQIHLIFSHKKSYLASFATLSCTCFRLNSYFNN